MLDLFCYQKYINYAGWLCLTFLNKYVIIIVIALNSVCCFDFNFFSEILDLSPVYPEAGTFPTSRKESHKLAHRLQQGGYSVMIVFGNVTLEWIKM